MNHAWIVFALFVALSATVKAAETDYGQVVRSCVPQGNNFQQMTEIQIKGDGARFDQGLRQVTNVVTLGIGSLVNDTVHEQTVELSYVGADGVPHTWHNCLLRDVDMSGSPFKNTVSISDCDFPQDHEGLRQWQCHYPRQEQAAVAAQ